MQLSILIPPPKQKGREDEAALKQASPSGQSCFCVHETIRGGKHTHNDEKFKSEFSHGASLPSRKTPEKQERCCRHDEGLHTSPVRPEESDGRTGGGEDGGGGGNGVSAKTDVNRRRTNR